MSTNRKCLKVLDNAPQRPQRKNCCRLTREYFSTARADRAQLSRVADAVFGLQRPRGRS